MDQSAILTINIDGAARGNPGPASFAFVIARDGQPMIEEAARMGSTTNNVAEYTALVRALERARDLGGKHLKIRSDSELVVKQMNGIYQVKNAQLRELHEQAKRLCADFDKVKIEHIPRAENARADRLCNEVLDGSRDSQRTTSPVEDRRFTPHAGVQDEAVREDALTWLRWAAASWAKGDATTPAPEDVWEHLWSMLEDHGLLKSKRGKK